MARTSIGRLLGRRPVSGRGPTEGEAPLAAPRTPSPDHDTDHDHRAELAALRGEGWLTCWAPHSNLRFSPNGEVHPCCANDSYVLGRVGADSLDDIWGGERVRDLRTALDGADYSLGCQECGVDHVAGNRLDTPAEDFDRFVLMGRDDKLRRVEFALSNTCNLRCIHCNGDLSSAIRSQREGRPPMPKAYGDGFFAQIRPFLADIDVAVFIGGEPFLTRECWRMWDMMIEDGFDREVNVTTNGTVFNDRVERYVRGLRMNVAVSIDGLTADVFEHIREGARFDEVMANRDRLHAICREQGSAFMVNHCVMRQNWHQFGSFLLDADERDMDVHPIPVLYPSRDSLFYLPADELAAVVDTMEADPAAALLTRNRDRWERLVRHLRSDLAGRSRATSPAAAVAAPTRRHPRPADEVMAAARAELEAWSGEAPLVVDSRDGVIVHVSEVPPASWLDLLGATRWEGGSLDELGDSVTSRSEAFGDLDEVALGANSWETTARITVAGVRLVTRSRRWEWRTHEGDGTRLILTGRPEEHGDPGPLPGGVGPGSTAPGT